LLESLQGGGRAILEHGLDLADGGGPDLRFVVNARSLAQSGKEVLIIVALRSVPSTGRVTVPGGGS
jgi:hypothetical protein